MENGEGLSGKRVSGAAARTGNLHKNRNKDTIKRGVRGFVKKQNKS